MSTYAEKSHQCLVTLMKESHSWHKYAMIVIKLTMKKEDTYVCHQVYANLCGEVTPMFSHNDGRSHSYGIGVSEGIVGLGRI